MSCPIRREVEAVALVPVDALLAKPAEEIAL
jgi:hypothetical protein